MSAPTPPGRAPGAGTVGAGGVGARTLMSIAAVGLVVGCGDDGDGGPAEEHQGLPDRCIVMLHGKGGAGGPTVVGDHGLTVVAPTGNGTGWGGREWRYATDADRDTAIGTVAESLDDADCRHAVAHGFSNGAAFITSVVCQGETFDGRLVGVVIDDPVPDHAASDCNRPDDVHVALYWTGALGDTAVPGVRCADIDWTCAGDELVGIEAFAAALGTEVVPSPNSEHDWHADAPEPLAWLVER